MVNQVPFFKPDLSGQERKYLSEVLESGWLTTASKAQEFERRFKKQVGAEHALAVNSCTAALHLGLEALGIREGDRVLVPSLTFTASAETVRYLNAHPVLCDIDYESGLVTPGIIEAALKDDPTVAACVVVHYGGQSAEMTNQNGTGIVDICRAKGVRILVDAAHAFPAVDSYGPVGSVGDITCFSFYANKTITSGEGGMLVTNDESLADRCRLMRLHGINRDVWDRFTSAASKWEYDVIAPGYKYNMADLNAAVGLAQLERAELMRRERQRCAARYLSNLADCPALDIPKRRVPMEWHAWHLFPVIVRPESKIGRDKLALELSTSGIGTSVHYRPLHRMTYYANEYGLESKDFPDTERFWRGEISLPIYSTLEDSEVDYVCERLIQLCT